MLPEGVGQMQGYPFFMRVTKILMQTAKINGCRPQSPRVSGKLSKRGAANTDGRGQVCGGQSRNTLYPSMNASKLILRLLPAGIARAGA